MSRFLVFILALVWSFHFSEAADNQPIPSIPAPSKVTPWAESLKCRDLFEAPDVLSRSTFPAFAVWLHGYAAGLGSALPLERLPAGSFHFFDWIGHDNFDAMVLVSCSKHMDDGAVETAIDVASLMVTLASKKKVLLRGTDGK